MSDFKILFPEIPYEASTLESVSSFKTDYPVTNVLRGGRQDLARTTAKATNIMVNFNLLNSKVVDYILISKANIIINSDSGTPQIKLYSNSSYTTSGAVTITNNLTSGSLIGKNSEDYFIAINQPTAYSAFFIEYISTISVWYELGKICFGQMLDLDRNPNLISFEKYNGQGVKTVRGFKLVFEGVETAKKNTFCNSILLYQEAMLISLYDPNDLFFNGNKLVNCRIISSKIAVNIRESWNIEIEVEEVL